jgi:hypothetical protein
MSAFDAAVSSLYQAPFTTFVGERKRLADALKAAGDKDSAARLNKLPRPPVSAWAVNQLWWQERADFEALLAIAARVKAGEREASKQHREALSKLREHATRILRADGNAATDATLRRVVTTLSAVAATGSFAPDPPGALSADRDPPGFEALGFAEGSPVRPPERPAAPRDSAAQAAAERARAAEAQRQEREERARRLAERERLSTSLRKAQSVREAQLKEIERLRRELEAAEQAAKETTALLAELQAQLASL